VPALPAIPFPLSTAPGASAQEAAGRLVNCYAEPLGETGPAKQAYRRSSGLTQFAVTGHTGYRGALLVKNELYVALADRLIQVDSTGAALDVGALAGTLPVTMARNNLNPTPQVAIVTENGAFISTGGSAPAPWPDADLPVPNSVAFQDGFFFWTIGDGRAFASDLNSSSVNSASFVTIQSRSSDLLLRGVAYKGVMLFFKTSSTEAWNDTANASPAFPYSRLQVIDRGLLGTNAISGYQDGFGQLLWVADDGGVYRFTDATSFGLQKVSPPDLDRLIAAVPDKSTLLAGCYVSGARSIWYLSSPSWTWEFNINTEKWNERESYQAGNNTTGAFSLWRGQGGTFAFGKWILGDLQSGNLGFIDAGNQQEFGQPVRMRLESGEVQNFPHRTRIARADFNWVTGVGVAAGSAGQQAPQASFSWSDDGGTKWSYPVLRSLGAQARAGQRMTVLNAGTSGPRGRRWRMDVSDAVYAGFLNATQSSDPRAY
jgi:hypothetical protein